MTGTAKARREIAAYEDALDDGVQRFPYAPTFEANLGSVLADRYPT
jgi:hypothetical protein